MCGKEIRSLPEKKLLCEIFPKCDPLPYRLLVHTDEVHQPEWYYVIPWHKTEEVLKSLWPFAEDPSMDQLFYDIHANKTVKFSDCRVIRYEDRNLIVSPYYFESGGTVIDLMDNELVDFEAKQLK